MWTAIILASANGSGEAEPILFNYLRSLRKFKCKYSGIYYVLFTTTLMTHLLHQLKRQAFAFSRAT